MPFVKRRGREAADLWATVPPSCPSAGEADESEPTARKPFAPVRPLGFLEDPAGRKGAKGCYSASRYLSPKRSVSADMSRLIFSLVIFA